MDGGRISGGHTAAQASTTSNRWNNITFNIYGAEGQNIDELAEIIAVKLQELLERKVA